MCSKWKVQMADEHVREFPLQSYKIPQNILLAILMIRYVGPTVLEEREGEDRSSTWIWKRVSHSATLQSGRYIHPL